MDDPVSSSRKQGHNFRTEKAVNIKIAKIRILSYPSTLGESLFP
jgi:hypothetical protein